MSYSEILSGLESIDAKIKSRNTKIDELGIQQAELADRLLTLEQKGAIGPRDSVGGGSRQSLGTQFARALETHGDILKRSGRLSVELSTKAATDPVTTAVGRNVVTGAVGAVTGRALGLHTAMRRRPSPGVSAVEYSRFLSVEGSAGIQAAEGDQKSYVRPTHELITAPAVTIAALTKISKQAVSDRAALVQAIDVTLGRSIDIEMDRLLVTGGSGFVGGYVALATAMTSTYDNLVDAISHGVSVMQSEGFMADVVALRPADWLSVVVARGVDGHPLSGSYLAPVAESSLRGLNVVMSPSVPAGKALILDSAHSELLMVEEVNTEIAYSGTDFESNLVTIRMETRVIPTMYTTGSMRLVTPAA